MYVVCLCHHAVHASKKTHQHSELQTSTPDILAKVNNNLLSMTFIFCTLLHVATTLSVQSILCIIKSVHNYNSNRTNVQPTVFRLNTAKIPPGNCLFLAMLINKYQVNGISKGFIYNCCRA